MRSPTYCIALLAATACGYTAGTDLSDEGVRTVAVEIVGNETFRHRYEIPLTRDLNQALMQYAGVSTGSHSAADAILTVDINEVQERSLRAGFPPVEEGELTFLVHAVLRDRKTGRVIREQDFVEVAEFHTRVGEDTVFAVDLASDNLAARIALALEPDF